MAIFSIGNIVKLEKYVMVAQIDIEMNDILFLSLMTFLIFATSDSLFAYEKHIYFFVLAYYFGIERPR